MILQVSPRAVVEAFLPFSGSAPLDLFYDTANAVGIDDQLLRLAIRRLITAGDVIQTGRGRSGSLHLTGQGQQRLLDDRYALRLAHAQDSGKAPWDGIWRLTAISVPEQHRAIRDMARRRLTTLGAAAISTGLYASPHNLQDSLPRDARPWLTTATTKDLDFRGLSDPTAIAEALWPACPTVSQYQAVDAALQERIVDPALPATVRRLYLAQAYESAMRDDPLLPRELRQDRWEPTNIRHTWAQMWAANSTKDAHRVYKGWLTRNE